MNLQQFSVSRSIPCLLLALAPLTACDLIDGPLLPDEYFQLTSQTGAEHGLCLESTNSNAHVGAIMKPCSRGAAQLWLAKRDSVGSYMLTTRARENHNECL